jgi:hypothetical protein
MQRGSSHWNVWTVNITYRLKAVGGRKNDQAESRIRPAINSSFKLPTAITDRRSIASNGKHCLSGYVTELK